MAALTFDEPGRARRKHLPAWVAPAVLIVAALGIVAFFWLQGPTITERDAERKTLNVVLPPPPPPPPEVKPEEKPPEPKPVPMDEPQPETPPPPQPQPQDAAPTSSNDALTAREGAGPSNYGLAKGDGGGSRIGGAPGPAGNGFAAYAERVRAEAYRVASGNPSLQGRYNMPEVRVWVNGDGRIARVEIVAGSGDRRRDAALERALVGLQLSQRPPAGLPYIRFAFVRSGA
jgi:protein TonB